MKATHYIYPMSMLPDFISKEDYEKRFSPEEDIMWNSEHTIGLSFMPDDPYFHFNEKNGEKQFESLDECYAEQCIRDHTNENEVCKFYNQ